jgi:hypothetical protein
MADLSLVGRKTFKVFNQDFIVDERYVVTKELGQGAYGIVWYVYHLNHCCRGSCGLKIIILTVHES